MWYYAFDELHTLPLSTQSLQVNPKSEVMILAVALWAGTFAFVNRPLLRERPVTKEPFYEQVEES